MGIETLTITGIQSDVKWENKKANLAVFEEKIRQIKTDTEVVILPEMFSTGFTMNPEELAEKMDGCTVKWMQEISKEKKIIVTGSIIIEEEGKYFNRLIWMLPNGQFGIYDKRHLFAYAKEDHHYCAGNKRFIASVNGWKLNLQICYDLRFPVWSRQKKFLNDPEDLSSAEYDVLVYVANWPERRSHAWKTLLQARAIENQCYVAGINRVGIDGNNHYHSGDSMIIDPMGEVLYSKAREEDTFTIGLSRDKLEEVRKKLPFLKDRDGFHIEI